MSPRFILEIKTEGQTAAWPGPAHRTSAAKLLYRGDPHFSQALRSPFAQPCLPQLLLVPGLAPWASGASSGARDAATFSGAGEELPTGSENVVPQSQPSRRLSFPPLGDRRRCTGRGHQQAAWSKPRCAKVETAPGNHRIARRRPQEDDGRWGRRRELPVPASGPKLIPPQYYVKRMEGPCPPAGPDLRVMGSSPARASVLGVESAGGSPRPCRRPLPCSLSVSLSLE
ncbi:uncharacterized protein LOC116600120 [Mustela erminea]|uniref:uncharacterized protein LOC116600120 n=1 Tax=Mustela erminea TaxID=36723 RepID=UPI001386F4EF|nr:uncharacterized protein LOC116600120 [Mustela erminea]